MRGGVSPIPPRPHGLRLTDWIIGYQRIDEGTPSVIYRIAVNMKAVGGNTPRSGEASCFGDPSVANAVSLQSGQPLSLNRVMRELRRRRSGG